MDKTIIIKEPIATTSGITLRVAVGTDGVGVDITYAGAHVAWSGAKLPAAVKTAAESLVAEALLAGKAAMGF